MVSNDKIQSSQNGKKPKKVHKNKTDLGPDFIPPDGRWSWVVCFAAGCSNLSTIAVLQQFGLIFRDRLQTLGITGTQITTLINVHAALGACTGLLNGPMFRRFTYRQVAFAASSLVVTALLFASIANSFITYLLTFSVLYGIGLGLNMSATSLALNTYFKLKRRYATGFSWTITSFGPIIFPYIVTALLPLYEVHGTVLLFSGFALHSVACSLVYQPVQWHVKKETIKTDVEKVDTEHLCSYCRMLKRKNTTIFSSQYLYNDDDEDTPGYEIIDPGTPMMTRANDGWFSTLPDKYGSKISLNSSRSNSRKTSAHSMKRVTSSNILQQRKEFPAHEKIEEVPVEDLESSNMVEFKISEDNSIVYGPPNQDSIFPKPRSRLNTFNREKENLKLNVRKYSRSEPNSPKCTCEEEKALLVCQKIEEEQNAENEEIKRSKYSIFRKIAIFFDLDLLKDFTYVNLMIGLTTANFAELNFSILTPFVLSDFGFTKSQIAFVMSLLGAMDSAMRFLIPFVAEKIGWDNRTFFVIGVLGMALGRIIIAHVRTYEIVLIAAAWIGLNKALRTIFMALVIPSHVPLARLPAASGLQLLFSGLFSFMMGPIIGFIRDATDYTVTLHCLNVATFFTAISWGLEAFLTSRRKSDKNDKECK